MSAGVVTALGSGVESFFSALLAGAVGLEGATLFDTSRFQAKLAAEAKLPPGDTLERGHRLALLAAEEALRGVEFGGRRAGVAVGTTLGGNRLFTAALDGSPTDPALSTMSSATTLLATTFGARGPHATLSVACASGSAAIGLGAEWIRRGEAEVVLAGGYDALSEFVFSGFDALRALSRSVVRPFDLRRDGLALGEGAGFVVLEDAERAARRGAPALALVRGYASAADALHMTRPSPSGEGLVRAVTAALRASGVAPDEIGFVSAHGTATTFNDRMEAAALRTVFGERVATLPVNSIKGSIGHTLGAAGALEAIAAALVLSRGLIPPTAGFAEPDPTCPLDVVSAVPRATTARFALSTNAAFAGTNTALILEKV